MENGLNNICRYWIIYYIIYKVFLIIQKMKIIKGKLIAVTKKSFKKCDKMRPG